MGFDSAYCYDLPPANSAIKRFDARYWSIDYPLSCVATIVSNSEDELTVHASMRSNLDMVGLIWSSDDHHGHPYLQYLPHYDYSGVILAFQASFPAKDEGTLTITAAGQEHIIRLFPYRLSGDLLVPPSVGKLRSYSLSEVAPDVTPQGGLDWYVVDFDNLYTGYSFDEQYVPPKSITRLFIAISPEQYGLGPDAKVKNVGNFRKVKAKTLYELTIENVSPDLIITKGDHLTVQVNYPDIKVGKRRPSIRDWKFNSFDFVVGEHRGLGTTQRHFKLKEPIEALWMGGRVSAVNLNRASPIGDVPITFRMANIRVTGTGAVDIPARSYPQSEHSMQMTSGYDDTYNITPWRQVEQAYQLGYRGRWVTYIGMSHYFKARGARKGEDFVVELDTSTSKPLNNPTERHFDNLFSHLGLRGYNFVWSVSYEILNMYMPEDWKQRNADGGPALSGWDPPSAFIVPTLSACINYLAGVVKQGMALLEKNGMVKQFQIGEPWWWDGSYTNNMPCVYDEHTQALYEAETGQRVPQPFIRDYTDPVTSEQRPFLEWLGDKLGQSTNEIRDQVLAEHPDALCTLLFFTPQIMTPSSEMLPIINFPKEYWRYPEYDFMQIEDYDWLIESRLDLNPLTFDAAEVLDYPIELVDYFLGFVLTPQEKWVWPNMNIAGRNAEERGYSSLFVWAYPQVIRDGILFEDGFEGEIKDVEWPLRERGAVGVDARLLEPTFLFKVGDDVRVTSGTHAVYHNGLEWLPVGGFGQIKPLRESIGLVDERWVATLSGIGVAATGDFIEDRRGQSCEVWLMLGHSAPVRILTGIVSGQEVETKAGVSEIALIISSGFALSLHNPHDRYSHADQLYKYPGDVGLEFIARMRGHRLDWGA